MVKYIVQYAHDNDNAEFIDAKYGHGVIQIETEKPVETQEELKEVARTIGLQAGYTSVGILSITEIEDTDEDSQFDIVGGNYDSASE